MCPRHKVLHPLGAQCALCYARSEAGGSSRGKRKHPSKNTRTAGRYDYQWQKVRAEAIRLQPYCSFCGTSNDLTGDHILPLKEGGSNTLDNVRVLCRQCNTRRENDYRKGRRY
ncbi:HNH endonuclease [Streptomyces antimicrobicus]|uniref:HNH endonuclease n=1 Tax=Streptomyces antimicrobicus TaxID=2883108 RepID=A0ABS8B4I0_9ACTN|nr:HNH endonuclease [Streptomyces antimicrobicus]